MLKKYSKTIVIIIIFIAISLMFDIKIYIGGEKFDLDYVVKKIENIDTTNIRENLKRALDKLTRKL